MRFTIRLFLYWVSIFLIFYVGVIGVVSFLWGFSFVIGQMVLVFVIVGMIPPALITAWFSRRLDYMESDRLEPPSFSGVMKAEYHFQGHTDQPFDEVLQRVDRQWIISFSDREHHILKFRTDARMFSWGVGGYLKMEDETTVTLIVYPIHPKSEREKKFLHQLIQMMAIVLDSS